MKRIVTSLVLLNLLAVPVIALAQTRPEPPPTGQAPFVEVIPALISITNWLFWGLVSIAAIAIIIAAYYFVTAAGDLDKTKTARNFVLYALIGVLVAFLAKGLVSLIGRMLGFPVGWM